MSTPNPSRTALITGASRGLGAAIALELGAMGANAAVNYLNSGNAAEQLCQRIRQAGGHAHAFKADVRSEIEVVRLVDEVRDAFGDIDVLVVNATGPQPFLVEPPDPIESARALPVYHEIAREIEAELADRAVSVLHRAGLQAWRNPVGHIAVGA